MTDGLPLISVIVPTWNRQSFIRAALDSIFAQTYPEERMQISVVNDGSTDATREILKGYGERIYCISQENKGIAGARNAGISRAKGYIITFLDSDDTYNAGRLDRVVDAFRKSPEAGMVFHPVELVDKEGRTLYRNFNGPYAPCLDTGNLASPGSKVSAKPDPWSRGGHEGSL